VRNLRGALHQIADLIADAIEADAREERVKQRRPVPRRGQRPVGESSPADRKAAEKFLEDLRKTGS
jgi:hypothetical protein